MSSKRFGQTGKIKNTIAQLGTLKLRLVTTESENYGNKRFSPVRTKYESDEPQSGLNGLALRLQK